jgi:hypothetical protein
MRVRVFSTFPFTPRGGLPYKLWCLSDGVEGESGGKLAVDKRKTFSCGLL